MAELRIQSFAGPALRQNGKAPGKKRDDSRPAAIIPQARQKRKSALFLVKVPGHFALAAVIAAGVDADILRETCLQVVDQRHGVVDGAGLQQGVLLGPLGFQRGEKGLFRRGRVQPHQE